MGEATYQTNASSGGSAVGFASYKVMHVERVCRKKIKAESIREASWIKELKGDSIA